MATFVISGFVTTMGLIIPRAAEHFGVDAVSMSSQFTWFTGGVFAGYLLSFIVFDRFSIKQVLLASYAISLASILLIHLSSSYLLLAGWLASFGIAISIAVCGSGTLITRLWTGRARQTVLVAQDAMFNGGGVIFSGLTTWLITKTFPFSSTYLVVAGIIVFVMLIAALSNFKSDDVVVTDEEGDLKTEWNVGFILIGISLLLFMTAKISIFIWAPQYVEERFSVTSAVSGQFMRNIFTAALIGSLAGTWLVSRINVKYLLYGFALVSTASVWLFTQVGDVNSMLLLGFLYGISVSATFNAYMAFALTFVAVPTHRNIAYMLLMSGLGSSFAPLVSSQAVSMGGEIIDALWLCFGFLLLVIATLAIGEWMSKHASVASRSIQPGS
ncbi:MAG: MFS transporter [Pseudomonadales bacterium]